jgi:curli biogenesis system outer membrane secretion channel CsgG
MRPLALAALAAALCFAQPAATVKKRIAIFDFENAAATGAVSSMFFSSAAPNTGKAVANLLINRLVQNANVTIIERAAIDKLIAEQNLSNSDRTDPLTAAKLGRILGVDAIVLGAITQNDFEDKVNGGGGSRFGGLGGYSSSTKHDYKARVKINARIVSPDTAEVLTVSEGFGEVIKKGVKVDMRDTRAVQAAMMGGDAGNGPIVSEAVDKAVTQLSASLETAFPKIPVRARILEGLIADVNETGRLVLNIGSTAGAAPGEKLEVWRRGKEIRDPASGKILLRDDTRLGDATITAAQENASFATFQGPENPKTGDIVKSGPKH